MKSSGMVRLSRLEVTCRKDQFDPTSHLRLPSSISHEGNQVTISLENVK